MTVRSVFEAAVITANVARTATLQTAANTLQEAINAVGDNAGANPQLGVTAAHDTTIRAANVTAQATAQKASHDHQMAITQAKAVMRAAGNFDPV
jgi:hypothetical protein